MKNRKLKIFLLVLLILTASFFVYVEVVNLNSRNMTYRQKVLKAIYPAWMWYNKITGKRVTVKSNSNGIQPPLPIYNLTVKLNDGSILRFDSLKGRKILLVNTASNCGYTNQYADLEKLHEKYKEKVTVIAFPANDFKEQEKGSDDEIAQYCKLNYGVTFPLAKKSVVVKNENQNEVFQWLTDKNKNGWNEKPPSWNFSKYLVDEQGRLIRYFDPAISPLSSDIINAIEQH